MVGPSVSGRWWWWCLWAAWGQDSNPAGFSGFGFPAGWDTRAGLASVVGWRLWLSRGGAVASRPMLGPEYLTWGLLEGSVTPLQPERGP